MLKNELKYLPFFGLGMQLFDFIFMKRKLLDDRNTIIKNLERSKKDDRPMWLVLFPEGTGKWTSGPTLYMAHLLLCLCI